MSTDRAAYLAFLDAELPEIQAAGKPTYDSPPQTLGESAVRALANTKAATFPGRKARVEADRRWGARRKLELVEEES